MNNARLTVEEIRAKRLLIAATRNIAEAQHILNTAEQLRRKARYKHANAQRCGCGHSRRQHTVSCSANFSGGFCMETGCRCPHFMMAERRAIATIAEGE